MRHKGSRNEYVYERNDDLLDVYRHVLADSKWINLYDVAQKVADSPAKQFYVSEYRARRVIARMMKGDQLEHMLPNNREMYNEIFKRVKEMQKNNPGMSLLDAVSEVIIQPAPKFYLAKESVVGILHKIKKELRWWRTTQRP